MVAYFNSKPIMTAVAENGHATRDAESRHVARFERRARVHTFLAALVFLLIAILVGFAGYVFFRAASITLDDFSRDRSVVELDRQSIEMLEGSEAAARRLRDAYVNMWEVGRVALTDVIWAEIELAAAQRRLEVAITREAAGRAIGTDLYWPDTTSRQELQVVIDILEALQTTLERHLAQVQELEAAGRSDVSETLIIEKWLEDARLELNLFRSQERQAPDEDEQEFALAETTSP